jgi:hypothetical protein
LENGDQNSKQNLANDLTRKPKPIMPMRPSDNIYSTLYGYGSPKNPVGLIHTFQPTGEKKKIKLDILILSGFEPTQIFIDSQF